MFRSVRQQTQKPSTVPGSNNRPLQSTIAKPENPFAQPQTAKTKAQLKNEKRREKKRLEAKDKAWDESSSSEEETLAEAFDHSDKARLEGNGVQGVDKSTGGSIVPAAPTSPLTLETSAPKTSGPGINAILDSVPGGAGSDAFESAGDLPDAPPPPSNMAPETEESRKEQKEAKPHPIQGGRKGPIGLAFPPPIAQPKPLPTSKADEASSWRKPTPTTPPQSTAKSQGQTKNASGPGNKNKPKGRNVPGQKAETLAEKPTVPEPRVRKEVRIRQGGANDLGSLASRVKNLVLDSTAQRQPKEKRDTAKTLDNAPTPAA